MSITSDTRWESFVKIQGKTLVNQITNVLIEAKKQGIDGMTAKEIAEVLKSQNIIRLAERQSTAPRLTELVDEGIVEVIGKRYDEITDRNVAVYRIKDK